MEKVRVICKTDAEILMNFLALKDGGFAFEYLKKVDGCYLRFVNCNGVVFGPYEYVYLSMDSDGTAYWNGETGNTRYDYRNNGKEYTTREIKEKRGKEIFSQAEIDQLLTAISEGGTDQPDEEYDEESHTLRLNKKKKEFFVTEKKKYGPYSFIYSPVYKDEENFQFIYKKRRNYDNWYYNLNGKDIGPFHGTHNLCRYDEQGRAVVDSLEKYNFILIDGKAVKCFDEDFCSCTINENNGHTIILGRDKYWFWHCKRDGVLQDFKARSILYTESGDIVYCKVEESTETWFFDDKQISVPVNGFDSEIYDTIITYGRRVVDEYPYVHYFMLKGTEYNGMPVEENAEGFVFLQNGEIKFFPWFVTKSWFLKKTERYPRYIKYREGNFLRLYYNNELAGGASVKKRSGGIFHDKEDSEIT